MEMNASDAYIIWREQADISLALFFNVDWYVYKCIWMNVRAWVQLRTRERERLSRLLLPRLITLLFLDSMVKLRLSEE